MINFYFDVSSNFGVTVKPVYGRHVLKGTPG